MKKKKRDSFGEVPITDLTEVPITDLTELLALQEAMCNVCAVSAHKQSYS